MKLESMSKNQVVVADGNKATLFSYGVPVAQLRDGKPVLAEGALEHSVTTSRYVYRFLGLDKKAILQGIKDGTIAVKDLSHEAR